MTEDVYRRLCDTMSKRGGRYPGRDMPQFYAMARVLFTEEEAAVSNAMPRGFNTAGAIAEAMGRTAEEVAPVLESMADKGLCSAGELQGTRFYGGPPFVPGIFEFQFLRGTNTERDRRLARLIRDYKEAFDAREGPPRITFPGERVIPVDRVIKAENTVHTYHQVASYIDRYEPLAVGTCFCRHQARLIDEDDHCGKPDDVCMQFGAGAQFVIDRGMGRKVTKEEALEILKKSEEAGLVHATVNRQEIDFLCNCCPCHCMILKTALAQPRPGLALNSGFMPVWDTDLCTACETCIDRCPTSAVSMGAEDVPEVNPDRCIGCGVCATGCPEEAIRLEERPGIPVPPIDQKALREAIKASRG
jgi:Pyruvate/2-oxoacid:ferredoxin oxidoreductase delta subunit